MRTEQEVLDEFKRFEYDIRENNCSILELQKGDCIIIVSKRGKFYDCHWEDIKLSCIIDMIEHKLLHELFEIWGWL